MGALKRRIAGALALAAGVAALDYGPASAQPNETTVLPEIAVTNTRLVGGARGARRGVAPGSGADVGTEAPADSAGASGIVTGTIITGASSTVITAQEIERSPGQTLQDVLAREPGIQVRNLFGSVNGARSSVDMRGFGAAGTSNTLVLINGRRLNDIDMAGVDFSAIPKNSIERIEITRGNSGAVLYGDGAVGGVINIVTKNAVDLPPSARVQAGFGSFNYREGNLSANTSANTSAGQFAASVYANAIGSDGYRQNNKLRQENAVGDFRWTNGHGYHRLFQSLRRQPASRTAGRPARDADHERTRHQPARRGDAVRFRRQERHQRDARHDPDAVAGHRTGRRRRRAPQEPGVRVLQRVRATSGFKANLTSLSVTPRLLSQHMIGGAPGKLITGIDVYHSIYDSDRSEHLGDPPIHRYDLKQTTAALYFQETVAARADTDIAFGARVQRNSIGASDRFDPNAPGGQFAGPQGLPLRRQRGAVRLAYRRRAPGYASKSRFSGARRAASACPMSMSAWRARRSACRPPSISRPRRRTTSKAASARAPARSPGRPASTTWSLRTSCTSARRPSPTPTSIRPSATASRTS